MGRFRRYSWNNVLLIASQRPNASHVAGFHAWHDLGRNVKKGEKGIMILAPVTRKKDQAPGKGPLKEPESSGFAQPMSLISARPKASPSRSSPRPRVILGITQRS
jgi:hypothetical protein